MSFPLPPVVRTIGQYVPNSFPLWQAGAQLPTNADEVIELLQRLDAAFLACGSVDETLALAGELATKPLLRWLEDQCASGEWYSLSAVRVLSHLCWSERCQADLCTSDVLPVARDMCRGAGCEIKEEVAQLVLSFLRDRMERCLDRVLTLGMLSMMASFLVESIPTNPLLQQELERALIATALHAVPRGAALGHKALRGCALAAQILRAGALGPQAELQGKHERIAKVCEAAASRGRVRDSGRTGAAPGPGAGGS